MSFYRFLQPPSNLLSPGFWLNGDLSSSFYVLKTKFSWLPITTLQSSYTFSFGSCDSICAVSLEGFCSYGSNSLSVSEGREIKDFSRLRKFIWRAYFLIYFGGLAVKRGVSQIPHSRCIAAIEGALERGLSNSDSSSHSHFRGLRGVTSSSSSQEKA